jgi:hypothetical protein
MIVVLMYSVLCRADRRETDMDTAAWDSGGDITSAALTV